MLLKMLLKREARIREDTLRGVASGAAGEEGAAASVTLCAPILNV